MTEVFSFLEGLATNSINLLSRLNYVSRGPAKVELVDEFILSHRKKTLSELCLDRKVGIYVVLATIIGVVGNEQWLDLLSECQVYKSSFPPLVSSVVPISCSQGIMLRSSFLMPSRSDESIDAFQCMIGQKFLFIVKKSCCHQATHDECFKAIRFCADPEILRIFDEGDLYSLSIWNKVVITTGLKKFAPSDDSFFFSDKTFDTTYSFFRYVFQRSRDCESSSSSVTVPREISTTLDI